MDAKTQNMQAELSQFEKTTLYKHLVEESKRRFRLRLSKLIDLALMSTDQNVRKIAQAVRQNASFWADLEEIRGARELTPEDMPSIIEQHFRPYDMPDFVEVGDSIGVQI